MNFSEQLLSWFDLHGRKNLPWQQQPSAYHVWLSEIMLQQTQVSTVIPYYQRFIQRYPNLQSLACASLDDILSLWTGLGYYARARNLHKAANIILTEHGGIMPQKLDALIALPGIGRSTAGAIMALAHHQKFAILDGNVKRVLARYHKVSGWPGNKQVENQLWLIAENLLPSNRIAHYIQAQMDLGATVCTRSKPKCINCPLQESCQAFQHGIPQNYPEPKPKKTIPIRHANWLVLQQKNGKVLLQQRPPVGIWGGLWTFPEVDSLDNLAELCLTNHHVKITEVTTTPSFKHAFSHFKLHVQPHLITTTTPDTNISENNNVTWYKISDALRLGLPAPVKSFLQSLPKLRE